MTADDRLRQAIVDHLNEYGAVETLERLAEAHNGISKGMGGELPQHVRNAYELAGVSLDDVPDTIQ